MTDTGRPVVLITGGGRGIGAATALRLAEDGFDLALTYRERRDRAEQIADRARILGARVELFGVDLADSVAVTELGPAVALRCGRWDALVNNAAAIAKAGPFTEVPAEELQHLFQVNVVAPFLLTQAAVRHFSTETGGRGGSIVNISSTAVDTGGAHTYVHYAMTKAALATMTVGVAREYARAGIRVNTVSPGTTDTEIHAAAGRPGAATERAASIPMGRAGEPDEIAQAVAHLLSAGASYTSGADLRVAGAM